VKAQVGKQEAVSGDPAEGLQHLEGAEDEIRSRQGAGQRRQGPAQGFGLLAKAADPKLAALVRHVGLSGRRGGGWERLALQQASQEKQRDQGNAEAQVGQGELRQQGNGALAARAQVAAHAQDAFKADLHQGAAIEAVRAQRSLGLALGAVIGSMPIGISNLLGIFLDGTRKGM